MLSTVVLSSCSAGSTGQAQADLYQPVSGFPWWNGTVFYEIFVRSFYDSNGDGIGDFNGVIQKLDYLNDGDPATTTDLGITGIWLMPVNPSPSYHGYDVTDYFAVNPEYGTMDEFKELISEAHKRGIRVITDLVINHTSSQHPWFIDAANSNSPYHDWYIWSGQGTNLTEQGPWGQQVWYPLGGQNYFALFWGQMPDLNFGNPEVVAEVDKIATYWLKEVGVDGFRLDAVKHLVEEGPVMQNSPLTHEYLRHFRETVKAANPDALLVGEIAGDDPSILATYLQGDQLDLAFDFNLAKAFVESAAKNNAGLASAQAEISSSKLPDQQYAPFLSNHDQNRVMLQLLKKEEKMKMAASLLLTSPGVPFVYYGEEIGMIGMKPDENIRTPMQWDSTQNGGFTTGTPWEPLAKDSGEVTVALQDQSEDSILAHYRSLIQARNSNPALQTGQPFLVDSDNPGIYALLRSTGRESVLVVLNLMSKPVTDYSLNLLESSVPPGSYRLEPIVGSGDFKPLTLDAKGGFSSFQLMEEIPPKGTFILRLITE